MRLAMWHGSAVAEHTYLRGAQHEDGGGTVTLTRLGQLDSTWPDHADHAELLSIYISSDMHVGRNRTRAAVRWNSCRVVAASGWPRVAPLTR